MFNKKGDTDGDLIRDDIKLMDALERLLDDSIGDAKLIRSKYNEIMERKKIIDRIKMELDKEVTELCEYFQRPWDPTEALKIGKPAIDVYETYTKPPVVSPTL